MTLLEYLAGSDPHHALMQVVQQACPQLSPAITQVEAMFASHEITWAQVSEAGPCATQVTTFYMRFWRGKASFQGRSMEQWAEGPQLHISGGVHLHSSVALELTLRGSHAQPCDHRLIMAKLSQIATSLDLRLVVPAYDHNYYQVMLATNEAY